MAHYAKGTRSPAWKSDLPNSGSHRLLAYGFRFYFTHLTGVLFTFPSRYLCTIGHVGVFSLGRWSSQLPAGFLVSRGTWERDPEYVKHFGYRTLTLYGTVFQRFHLCSTIPPAVLPNRPITPHNTVQPTPAGFQLHGLDSSLFAHRYSGNRFCFLFLRVLRWFSSPRSPSCPMDSGTIARV